MSSFVHRFVCVLALTILFPALAVAGMPSIGLSEIAKMRLENISFFLAVFLGVALIVKVLWNSLCADFTSLSRLTYFKALALMALWGFVFVLVLTMISGARELMTPGAWKKNGLTYHLTSEETQAKKLQQMIERREHLGQLWQAIWEHSRKHGPQLPTTTDDFKLPPAWWKVPYGKGMTYVYLGGTLGGDSRPLVLEPEVFDEKRLVLFTNGQIQHLDEAAIAKLFDKEEKQ